MSATPTDADSASSQPTGDPQANSSASYPTAITTYVTETVSNSVVEVITTTSYSGAPLATAVTQSTKSSVPVAPIAGGAAGGVVLAVAIVVAWVWWGKCIKRKTLKERQETLARLQVRENTRRNASSNSFTSLPHSSRTSRREKKVSFVSTPASAASTLKGTVRDLKEDPSEKTAQPAEPSAPPSKGPVNPHKPVRPSPLGRANSRNEQAPLLAVSRTPSSRPATPPQSPFKDSAAPPRPRRLSRDPPPKPARRPSQDAATPFPTQSSKPAPLANPAQPAQSTRPSPTQSPSPTSSSPVQPFLKRQVTHKVSAASSMSAYSTESGEERQKRVSTSLVMAALGHMDPRRSWLGNYLPLNRRSRAVDDLEQSRLSTMSAASAYSQVDAEAEAEADEHVGYAFGGEESNEG